MSAKARKWAPLALLFACLVLYFSWFIRRSLVDAGVPSLFSSFDYQSYFRPRFWLGSEELRAHHLPLWNPYEWGGLPLLATAQPAALYPPKVVIFALFNAVTAHWIFLVFHYFLLAASFVALLRSQGIRGPALFTGAAITVFATLFLASNYHPVRIACLAWVPIQIILAERVGRDEDRAAFAGLALVVALQLLAGYPEFTIDTGLLLAVLATASWATGRWKRPPWRSVPWLAGAFVLGAAASGVQTVPFLEMANVARRVDLATQWKGATGGVVSSQAPLLVVPGLIIFGIVGIVERRARVALVVFAVCWGMEAGLWRLLGFVPGFNMVRYPFVWMLLSQFFFAWVAAAGCESLTAPNDPRNAMTRVALALVALSGLVLGAAWIYAWVRSRRPGGFAFFESNVGNTEALVLGVAGAAALALVASVALVRSRVAEPAWLLPLGLLTLSHLAAEPHGRQPAPFEPPNEPSRIVSLFGSPALVHGRTLSPRDILYGYNVTERLPSALGIEYSMLPYRQRQIQERLRYYPVLGTIDVERLAAAHGFVDAMDVELMVLHVLATPFLEQSGFVIARRDGVEILVENPTRMGRAWVNYAIHAEPDGERALDYVLSPEFDPHHEVLLEHPPRGSYPTLEAEASATAPVPVERRVSPTEVEYTAVLSRPGVLVVSESAYPGWKATVDGQPHEWVPADYVLRGVELSPGRHRVRFSYRPASVRWGIALSAVALTAIGAVFASAKRRRRPG